MANIIKLYAAYKSGFLGNNILDTYFSFMANMISEERLSVVEDTVIAAKFEERYKMELPLPFIRQVLGVGVQNGSFIEDHGKYSVVVNEIAKHCFSKTDFDALWKRQKLVYALETAPVASHRRRCASKHKHCLIELRALCSDLQRAIARSKFGMIGWLVLLIHHNKLQPRKRREHRAARANDHIYFS